MNTLFSAGLTHFSSTQLTSSQKKVASSNPILFGKSEDTTNFSTLKEDLHQVALDKVEAEIENINQLLTGKVNHYNTEFPPKINFVGDTPFLTMVVSSAEKAYKTMANNGFEFHDAGGGDTFYCAYEGIVLKFRSHEVAKKHGY